MGGLGYKWICETKSVSASRVVCLLCGPAWVYGCPAGIHHKGIKENIASYKDLPVDQCSARNSTSAFLSWTSAHRVIWLMAAGWRGVRLGGKRLARWGQGSWGDWRPVWLIAPLSVMWPAPWQRIRSPRLRSKMFSGWRWETLNLLRRLRKCSCRLDLEIRC